MRKGFQEWGKLQKWKGKHVQKFTARGLESPGAQHFTDYTHQTTRSVCNARMRSSPMDCEIKKRAPTEE